MSERRPPTKPGRPGARQPPRVEHRGHGSSVHDERTDASPRSIAKPAIHSREGFDHGADTTSTVQQVASSDISLIDAEDLGPAPSDPGFDPPPRASVFVPPPAGVDGASFGELRSTAAETLGVGDLSTDSMKAAERPVEVRKWRIGGDDAARTAPVSAGVAAPPRIRTSVVPLPPALDIDELRRTLQDAEQLLGSLSVQLSSREGQGAKAQLSAALHRIAEALAMLPRS